MTSKKTIIIGAGVVGAALADELSAKNWDDITVIDQGALPMPGGSSSHAPGMVFQNHADRTMSEFAQYTVEKFSQLEFEGQSAFQAVGGLEIATTPERLAELRRRAGWAQSWGVNANLVSAAECVQLQPILDEDRVLGGLHSPDDGAARAVVAVNAQLERAKQRGVKILENHTVTDIVTDNGVIVGVDTDHGFVEAEIVVCCAGIWGPKIAAMVGEKLPMTAMEHQVAWTEPMPSLRHHTEEATAPMIRHLDAGLYYRDRFDKLEIGSFAHRPIIVEPENLLSPEQAEVMPSMHPFTPQDFEPQWRDTQMLMPETCQVPIEDGFNGIMAFTVDDFPIMGPSSKVSGLWFAEGVWVTQSAGVGLAMAEWLSDGYVSTFAVQNCDINRFERYQLAPSYIESLNVKHYTEIYDIKHPLQPLDEPRGLRVSPFYPRQKELGGMFLESNAWERPHWYGVNENLEVPSNTPNYSDWTSQYWSPIIAAEAKHTREHVALYDMTSLKTALVEGPGAESFLLELTTGNVARPAGSVNYCLMLDRDGSIRSDVTVARLTEEKYQIGVNGNLDLAWLRQHADQRDVLITDVTGAMCCIGIWGPRSRDVLSQLSSSIDFSSEGFRYFQAREGYIEHIPVTALRVSYVGELGWEIYASAEMGLQLWDMLYEAGKDFSIIAAGRGALDTLRIEKGYRSFGTDMTFEHFPNEAGLGFALKRDEGFIGAEHATAQRKRRLVCLAFSDNQQLLLGNEPVFEGDQAIGYVTSATYSPNLGHGIAYAWVFDRSLPSAKGLIIEGRQHCIEAEIVEEPLYDPNMQKVRV